MSDETPIPAPPRKPGRPKKVVATIVLTDAQQETVRALWDKDPIDVVAQKAFGNPALTLNSPEAGAVRAFIASLGTPSPVAESIKKPITPPRVSRLTDEQKDNIAALLNNENPPGTMEIARMVFPDSGKILTAHKEYRLVYDYIRELNEDAVDIWEEPVATRRYYAPNGLNAIVGLCNRYVGNAVNSAKALYDLANIKKAHESNLRALLTYMETAKFTQQASQYDRKADRDLFESTFVRQVHDKAADLTPEEVDMYISIATETVEVSKLQRDITKYERVITDYLDGDMDGEKRSNLSKPFVDALTALRQKAGESKKRLKELLDSVAGKRADRIKAKNVNNDALINLINLWIEEQSRNDLLELAKREHEEDEQEFNRIRDLDDAIALMAGLSREEARGGY